MAQATKPIQKHRLAAVGTPLDDDVLVLYGMTGTEYLGQPFEYELELLSTDTEIDLAKVTGGNMTVRLEILQSSPRYFNGYVSHFSLLEEDFSSNYARYRATLRPWFWFLTRTADCRIFQDKDVIQIIEIVFGDHGYSDFDLAKLKNRGKYKPREYCVQYRESDFDFLSRVMQEEGIGYYFKHENGKHTMVLSDDYGSHEAYPDYATIPYYPPDKEANRERDHLYMWSTTQQVQPGTHSLNAFDFKTPKANLRVNATTSRDHKLSKFEYYDYDSRYVESGIGEHFAQMRNEESQAQHQQYWGEGNTLGLGTGYLFSLEKHFRGDFNREYLIIGASYNLQLDSYEVIGGSSQTLFTSSITAIDAKQPFRPVRTASKPVIQGPQTAVVVGPSGEEIYTDEHGRVKCLFHWDRYGKGDETSSCWIRVAQAWAGKKWGAIFLPRIGHEVIVDFLEGDGDRPIITGCVYNGDNKPPYDLPAEKTKSTTKSNSSKGGEGFNEIRIEDLKGEEQIFIHAERNEDVRVKNDSLEWIGNNRHLIVGNGAGENQPGEQHEQVKGDKHLIISKVAGGAGNQFEKVEGDKHQTVDMNHNQKVGGDLSINVTGAINEKSGGNFALEAAGSSNMHIKAGMNMVIEAGTQLTLKVGGSFIVISMAGIDISGPMVKINSGGSAGSGAGCSPDAPQDPVEPQEADNDDPGEIAEVTARPITKDPAESASAQVQALVKAHESGAPFCAQCAAAAAAGN